MPQPTQSDLHVNRPLTNVAIKFTLDQEDFIFGKVFPILPVTHKSDIFVKYSRRDWLRAEARERGLSSESAGSGFDVDTNNTYNVRVFAVHKDVDDKLRSNQDQPFNLDSDATQWVMQQLLLRREIRWADSFFKIGIWDTDLTGVASGPTGDQFLRWDDPTSTPIQDIKNGIRRVQRRTGKRPNRLSFDPFTWDTVTDHPDVVDRVKHTQLGVLTQDLFAQLVGLKAGEVMVAQGVVDTALENVDEAVDEDLVDFIMPNGALLTFAAPAPSTLQPSAGYIFSWTGLIGAGPSGQRIKRFRMEELESDRIEGEIAFDAKITASELGLFFTTPITP